MPCLKVVPRRKFDIVAAWSIVRGQDGGSSDRQRVRITDSLLIRKEHASNAGSLPRRNSLIPCQIKIDLPDQCRRGVCLDSAASDNTASAECT